MGSPLLPIIDLIMQRLEKMALSMFKDYVLFIFDMLMTYALRFHYLDTFLECFNSFQF